MLKTGLAARFLVGCSLAALLAAGGAMAQEAPIVHPGAPGQAPRSLTAEEAVAIADNRFSADDVRFMRDMIVHHGQAVQMAALVGDRTSHPAVVAAAGRIDASQADEIAFMRRWLAERGQDATDPHAMHGHHTMQGMATPDQLEALAAASGPAFDRLFLELMIAHHEGEDRQLFPAIAEQHRERPQETGLGVKQERERELGRSHRHCADQQRRHDAPHGHHPPRRPR